MLRRTLGLLLLAGCLVGAWLLHRGIVRIPDRHNPWAALRVDEAPGWLTRLKLARVARDPELCLRTLATAGWTFAQLPDKEFAPGCGFENVVRIDAARLAVGTPFALSCPAAVALALWERHLLQPAAHAHFGHRVVRMEHFGSYACRDIAGRSEARRSRHATADALDIAGLVLADGRRIRIVQHWSTGGNEALFLRELHAGACRVFDTVLGPDYDAAHRDHFHVERGGNRVCR
jgi:hypothetical protein